MATKNFSFRGMAKAAAIARGMISGDRTNLYACEDRAVHAIEDVAVELDRLYDNLETNLARIRRDAERLEKCIARRTYLEPMNSHTLVDVERETASIKALADVFERLFSSAFDMNYSRSVQAIVAQVEPAESSPSRDPAWLRAAAGTLALADAMVRESEVLEQEKRAAAAREAEERAVRAKAERAAARKARRA